MPLDRLISLRIVRPLAKYGIMAAKPGIPILMYHSISNDPENRVSPYYRLSTPPALFREQMCCLRDHGYSVISLTEAVRRLGADDAVSDRAVVLTFDDGFSDFQRNAWPILGEFSYSATVFLPTAFIGDHEQLLFKDRSCLTWNQVRELCSNGTLFGSHTVNHVILHDLNWSDIKRELSDSKKKLEDQLGISVSHFAYPYAYPQADGEFCRRFREVLAECGYGSCVTTCVGRSDHGNFPWNLKRLPVNSSDDQVLFLAKLQGAYDWFAAGQSLMKKCKHYLHKSNRGRHRRN